MNGTHIGEIFPELYDKALDFNEALIPVTIILMTFAVISRGIMGLQGDIRGMVQGLASILLIAVLIPAFPEIANDTQLAAYALVDEMGANPSDTSQAFGNLIVSETSDGETEVGFFDILTDSNGGFGKALLYLALLLSSFIALIIQYLAFIVQQLLVVFGIALAPAFLVAFHVNCLRPIATKYMLSLTSVLLIPIGFGIANIMTAALLERAAGAELYSQGAAAFASRTTQSLFFAFAVSLWIVVSTIAAPMVVMKVIQTGANAGGALFQSFGSALGLGTAYGMMARSAAQMSGSSGSTTALATSAAAIGGLISGPMGGGGFLIPTAIGMTAAKAGLTKESSKGSVDYNLRAAQLFK